MDILRQDLRQAVRALLRTPAFAGVAVVTLALAIGANTALFSVVDAVLLRPLPYRDPDRLALVWQSSPELPTMMVSYPDFLDWRARSTSFEAMAVYNRYQSLNLTGAGEPERLAVALVSHELFDLLGVNPARGRAFRPEEDRPGAERVAVLSHGLWQRRFGGDPAVLGRALTLDGQPYTIVGVMPASFNFPSGIDLWTPLGPFVDAAYLDRATHRGLLTLARLRSGIPFEQAKAELDAIAKALQQQYPDSNREIGVALAPLRERVVGHVRPALVLLLGAVAFVLLVACANLANLTLARVQGRRAEMAIRAALGAGRVRLVRLLITESLLLAAAGGALGTLLATWSVQALRFFGTGILPRLADVAVDGRVLAFTAALCVVTAVLFGLAPAWRVGRGAAADALRAGRAAVGRAGEGRARAALVVSEVALSLVLLAGAGVMVRSLARLLEINPGFEAEGVLTAHVTPPPTRYSGPEQTRFWARMHEQIVRAPGATRAALVTPLPFSGEGWQSSVRPEGYPTPANGEFPLLHIAAVSPGYFAALGIPLQAGRDFTEADDAAAMPVGVVSEAAARRFWPGEVPLGRRVKTGDFDQPWITIVGVVGDVKRDALEEQVRGELYRPFRQEDAPFMAIVARGAGDPGRLAASVRAAVRAVDPEQPLYEVRPFSDLVDESLAGRRLTVSILSGFATLALVLAAVGIHGVVAYTVSQRTREIGIRMAVGAARRDVLRMVAGRALRLAAMGIALGLAGALVTARLLQGLEGSVRPYDPLTLAAVAALLAATAGLAALGPARRAARVDPIVALRDE